MVRIRMSRIGRVHRPFYRISAIDQRTKRNGKVIEPLGWYDPIAKDQTKQVNLNIGRVKHWLSVGAQPSDTVRDILIKMSLVDGTATAALREKRIANKKNTDAKAVTAASQAAVAKAAGKKPPAAS